MDPDAALDELLGLLDLMADLADAGIGGQIDRDKILRMPNLWRLSRVGPALEASAPALEASEPAKGMNFMQTRPSSAGGGACGRIVHAVPDPAPGSLAQDSWSHSWGELVPMKPCGACQPHRSA
jgi:hypothetical protein